MDDNDIYIRDVVTKYSRTLLRAAYMVLRSTGDAEDAVQETFIKLITKKPVFNDGEHEKAWLLRVTVNTALNMRRSAARTVDMPDEDLVAAAEYAPDCDGRAGLLEAVLALPAKYSTVIHLYYYEGLSIKEIASVLRIPSATVGTRLARARDRLKATLRGE